MKNLAAYIDGTFLSSGKKVPIVSPNTNEEVGSVPGLSKAEIQRAFSVAKQTFPSWRNTTLEEREEKLETFNDLLMQNKEEIAQIISQETGKLVGEALTEVERTFTYVKETISKWREIKTKKVVVGQKTNNILRVPLGVVLAISPFNYPLNLAIAKIAPGLLVGNTIVFKPATNGSLTGGFIAVLMAKAKVPRGVFNLVTGRGREIGDELISNPNIDMISFTGSVATGRKIGKNHPLIPLVLELGGNDAAYVREDANLDHAAKEVAKGAFSFSGQRCTAIKRLILPKRIKDAFYEKLTAEIRKIQLVPLVNKQAVQNVQSIIQSSRYQNDLFVMEGKVEGNFVPPHVVETTQNSPAWKEEAFGPVLPVLITESEENLLNIFNDTNFGLQNSIFTSDSAWATQLAKKIESGTVNINASSSRGPDVFPFLGVKDSGFGTQGISEALKSMTRILNIIDNAQ